MLSVVDGTKLVVDPDTWPYFDQQEMLRLLVDEGRAIMIPLEDVTDNISDYGQYAEAHMEPTKHAGGRCVFNVGSEVVRYYLSDLRTMVVHRRARIVD